MVKHDCRDLVERCACCGEAIPPAHTFCGYCKDRRYMEQQRRWQERQRAAREDAA